MTRYSSLKLHPYRAGAGRHHGGGAYVGGGRMPLNPSLARAIIEGIRAKMRSPVNQGYLTLAVICWIDDSVK